MSFDDDFNFVFAKSGKARAPAGAAKATGGGAGGGKGAQTPQAQRRAVLEAVKRKPQVMVKITSFGKSAQAVTAHLDYISRNGRNEVFDEQGDELAALAERLEREPREVLHEAGERLVDQTDGPADTAAKRRPRERVTMNLMLSMPEGTDTGAFELSVRDFLHETFPKNDHVFAFHDDKHHYHAHIVVGLQGDDGQWLNPRKADLKEWRENFAEALEHRGIEASATPAYTRARGKEDVRKGVVEAERRGTRTRPERARGPKYDAEVEAGAIQKRAAAWSRIGDHYQAAGDQEAAEAIKVYLADHFDYHPAKDAPPVATVEAPARPERTPAAPKAKAPKERAGEDRER